MIQGIRRYLQLAVLPLSLLIGTAGAKTYQWQMTKEMQPNEGSVQWVKDSVDLSNPAIHEIKGKGEVEISGTMVTSNGNQEFNQTIKPGEPFPTGVFQGDPTVKVESDKYCGCAIANGSAIGGLAAYYLLGKKKAPAKAA